MARTKSKTTKEQLDIALQKKEQLTNELVVVKKDIAYLEAEVNYSATSYRASCFNHHCLANIHGCC